MRHARLRQPARRIEEIPGRQVDQQRPLFEEDDAVGYLPGELDLVGDEHHGGALLRELRQDCQHFRRHLGIERAGHLVEQQIARLHGERPADADALALAAGKLRRIGVGAVGEPDRSKQRPALGLRLARGRFSTSIGASVMLPSAVMCG